MSAMKMNCLTKGSNLVTVSSPLIGEEQKGDSVSEQKVSVDLKALNEVLNRITGDTKKDEVKKDSAEEKITCLLGRNPVGRMIPNKDFKTQIVYDFAITPSTSATLATWQGISVYSDSQVSSYWKYVFQWGRVDSAEIQLDFHQYMNLVGVADKVSALAISYRSTTSPAIPGYSSISDDGTCKLVTWSQAKPVFIYRITPEMMKHVNYTVTANMGVKTDIGLSKWQALEGEYSRGYVHIASQDTFCAGTTGRSIIGRLVMRVTLTSRI